MIYRSLAEKTLLDLGGFELDEELSTEVSWQFFYVKCPEITVVLQWPNTATRAKAVFLGIVFPELQMAVYKEFFALLGSEGLKVSELEDLEDIATCMRTLLEQHSDWCARAASGDEFDPGFDDPEDWEDYDVRRIRLGQTIYRRGLERLWDGKCAVTGIGVRELLRASHAKPWAECETGMERISPYNGFLLSVSLDALFDKFLISFDDDGKILIAPWLSEKDLMTIGITPQMKLRLPLRVEHLPFLRWHRQRFYEISAQHDKVTQLCSEE